MKPSELKAAEKLYIVQPTLTSAIQELENEVGITIFMRTNKGVIANSVMEIGYITKKNAVMSKIGEQYLEEIEKALDQIDKSVIYEE